MYECSVYIILYSVPRAIVHFIGTYWRNDWTSEWARKYEERNWETSRSFISLTVTVSLIAKFIRNYFMSSPKHFTARFISSFSHFYFIVVAIVYFVYFAWQCHLFNCVRIRIRYIFRFLGMCVCVCYTSRRYGWMNVILVQWILFLFLFYLETCLDLHREILIFKSFVFIVFLSFLLSLASSSSSLSHLYFTVGIRTAINRSIKSK